MATKRTTFVPQLALAAMLAFPLSAQAADPAALVGPYAVADVAERVTPAVVNISTERARRGQNPMEQHPFFREFFGPNVPQGQPREMGAGSGVVISADGYIVTNNHVIEGADQIKVAFADKREYRAKLIGTDKPSDLALIKIDAKGLTPINFGDSSGLRLGEFVLAIGNPFGVGQTVTLGIVSAKGRANIGIVDYEDFIQTDAAINPGNSGGALVNLRGELVGINTAILSKSGGYQGIGFSVPSNMVQPILQQIRQHGRVRRGWLGIAIQDITPDLAKQFSLEGIDGVLISDVMEDGPGAKFDIKQGDVVLQVNTLPTKTAAQLRNAIGLLGPGANATLNVLRDGKKKNVQVVLGEKKDEASVVRAEKSESSLLSGLTVDTLTDDLRRELGAPLRLKGLVVRDVEAGTPGADAGLTPGDVIVEINRKKIETMPDLKRMNLDKDNQALLRVWRRPGSFIFVVLKR